MHHSIKCPQTVDGGYSFHTWKVVTNTLNKKSHTAQKEWSSTLGLVKLRTSYSKESARNKKLHTLQEANVKMGLKRMGCNNVNRIHVAQDKDKYQIHVTKVITFRIYKV